MTRAIHGHGSRLGLTAAALLAAIGILFSGCNDDDDPNHVDDCQLTLANPNGGESFAVGDTVAIVWEAGQHCGDLVRIDLTYAGDSCSTVADSVAADEYDWIVADCADDTSGYAIRLTDLLSGATDTSDSTFIITTPILCQITVAAPNGGEYVIPGTQLDVSWESSQCGETVTIDLLRDGTVCQTIAAAAPNSGYYSWTAARCGTQTQGYTVRVTDDASGASDASDAVFQISTSLPLSYVVENASPGEANGYSFARLVDLDPALTYTGGMLIRTDTCIRGHGAKIDLGMENIMVMADVMTPTRFDIDHCLITNGGIGDAAFGGAIEYWALCYGEIFNNTFYYNQTSGVYLHEDYDVERMRIYHNIFWRDATCGVVRFEGTLTTLVIRYNCSNGHQGVMNFCEHCGCVLDPTPVRIAPLEAGAGNFEDDPKFVSEEPKRLDLHLRFDSPCIGAGEEGEDLGAWPYVP